MECDVDQGPRKGLAERALEAKASKGLTWSEIAASTPYSEIFVTSALLGQHPLPEDAAEAVADLLGLSEADTLLLQRIPLRGDATGGPPSDPTLYRFHEMMMVYGPALKALLHEHFGDGIMSAINFRIALRKEVDPEGGHRAVVTLDGKFLPSKPF
jgi:cyanate lyase